MRLIILLTLLGLPVAEIWILIYLTHRYDWWVFFYLVVVAMLGLQLIRQEKILFLGRMMRNLIQGGGPLKSIFGSARYIIAGILLIIPGIITDIIACILLIIPVKKLKHASPETATGSPDKEIIEGEFRREE